MHAIRRPKQVPRFIDKILSKFIYTYVVEDITHIDIFIIKQNMTRESTLSLYQFSQALMWKLVTSRVSEKS